LLNELKEERRRSNLIKSDMERHEIKFRGSHGNILKTYMSGN
jgi:hypothetical protein